MKKNSPLFFSLLIAAVLRIGWKLYTWSTYEDAFITFRFARNLANGLGFVYNANERVDGTTTPLFTILMAAWIKFFPNFVVLGASLFGLSAGLLSIFLVWKLLDELQVENGQKFLITGVLVLSDKIWGRDMGGMETPLVICAMMASYWLLLRNQSVLTGVLAGILLWLRLDGVFWIAFLTVAAWYTTRRFPAKFIMLTLVVYLPWVVFATLYFGSPIPHTIYAKWVAYTVEMPPVLMRAEYLLRWLTPFSLSSLPPAAVTWSAFVTVVFSAIGAIVVFRRYQWLLVLPVFCLAEMIRLVAAGQTFEPRYFVPLFWVLMILFGFGVHVIWGYLSRRFNPKPFIAISMIAVYICISLWFGWQKTQLNKDMQDFVYDASLQPLGVWLENHTPPSASVFLEPLGYVGFYANRRMIDEVGLVSPQVVALKQQGDTTFALIKSIHPDYVVLHCDDSLRAPDPFHADYAKAVEFNPLNFDPKIPIEYDPASSSELQIQAILRARTACYQAWKSVR